MIKIEFIRNPKREFTKEESKEMIPLWERITKKASDRVVNVAEAYGDIDKSDPEWTILAKRVDDCIQDWAEKVRRLGGEPREMWGIVWLEDGKQRVWRLDESSYKTLSVTH